MKTLSHSLFAVTAMALTYFAANGQTPVPQVSPSVTVAPGPNAEAPAISPAPGGTSMAGAVGLTIYDNAVYLVRESGVTRLDTTTIPAGYMLTLDGRVVQLPAGVQFPGATPKAGPSAAPSKLR